MWSIWLGTVLHVQCTAGVGTEIREAESKEQDCERVDEEPCP